MIVDNLNNTALYEHVHPLFKKAFDYLKSTDLSKLEVGKVELQGKDLFLSVSDSNMKIKENAKLEVHDKYIDIQIPLSKAEAFGWEPRAALKHAHDVFNTEKDIQFFTDNASTLLTLAPGNFVIFFPEDAHAPCIGEGVIRKIVVKVKL